MLIAAHLLLKDRLDQSSLIFIKILKLTPSAWTPTETNGAKTMVPELTLSSKR